MLLITNLRVDPDPRGRCLWRQSRQTLPEMRRVNTIAKYMYVQVVSWYISKSVFLHSAAIHLDGIAEKNQKKKMFLKRTNSRLGPYMYFAIVFYALQAKSASIDVTNSALSGRGLLLNL